MAYEGRAYKCFGFSFISVSWLISVVSILDDNDDDGDGGDRHHRGDGNGNGGSCG